MREINVNLITRTVRELVLTACTRIHPKALCAIQQASRIETNKNASFALDMLVKNAECAQNDNLPVCQDTGLGIVFLKIGQEIHFTGGLLDDAIQEGIRQGYHDGYFRKSVLDPISGINTKDNTPAIVYTELVSGEEIAIQFLPKGFGSENMSKLFMLTPAEGITCALDKVVETVRMAGANPCPPILVGVGIGGSAEYALLLAKKALLRDVGSANPNPLLEKYEQELLVRINALHIGAQGFSGSTTALGVHILSAPTHICAFPVGINIQCNCVRKAEIIL